MGSVSKAVVCIVTPGTRTANNGNWRTAARWAEMLRGRFKVIVQTQWEGENADALIALHARRSHDSVSRYRASGATGRVAVVLTGTDLYHDLPASREAAHCLDLADRIVTLQDEAVRLLEARWRRKAQVIFQSARGLRTRRKPLNSLECVAVGHLRAEKDPLTLMRAIARIPQELAVHVRHIGAPLDLRIAAAARALEEREPRYRYLGALPHGLARAAIGRAHLLVHPSIMEGGANVIAEAITGGTAVVASRVSGNIGMLGRSYSGYFPAGDESALARRLVQALEERMYLAKLEGECAARRPVFSPALEARSLRKLVAELVA